MALVHMLAAAAVLGCRLLYRLERAAYLASGPAWPIVRLVTRPLFAVIRPGAVDIDCRAEIGPGLMIAHPGLGIVISHHASIGGAAIFDRRQLCWDPARVHSR